jgi:hypothetical protein
VIRSLGWEGALSTGSADFWHFNDASVNSTKLNLILESSAEYSVDLDALGNAHHELTLAYHNPLPEWREGRDQELVNRLMLSGIYGGYLRVFAPSDAVSEGVEIDGTEYGFADTGVEGETDWWGTYVLMGPGEEHEVVFRWTAPLATQDPDRYELFIQKQPGTEGLCLEVTVSREGQPASEVNVVGGDERDGQVCLTTDVQLFASFE